MAEAGPATLRRTRTGDSNAMHLPARVCTQTGCDELWLCHTVADPGLGKDVPRIFRVVSQLVA